MIFGKKKLRRKKMDLIDDFKKAWNFRDKAMEECLKHYPRHQKTVEILWMNYLDLLYINTEGDYVKFMHYLCEFSDFIAKKYFPDEINEDWRRPIMLEDLINCAMINRLEIHIKKDPKFRDKIVEDLQTNPKIKDDPLANLIEGLIAGGGCVSTIEMAEVLDISHDSMLKQTQKLIDKKILLPERDYYQSKIDEF